MKIKNFKIILLLFITLFLTADRGMPAEPDAFIDLPDVKSATLKNGLKTFYIKDELPQLAIIASVGFGKLYENRQNAGISDLLAKTIDMAGSKNFPGRTLYENIESIGGRFSVSSSWEETIITIRVLERYSETAFSIISDILKNPNLDPVYIEKARSLLLDEIRRKKDEPDVLAFETLREIIFNGSGYGSVPDEKTVRSSTKKDLQSALEKYFTAGNIIIGISTSIPQEKINKFINDKFTDIVNGPAQDYSADKKTIAKTIKENAGKIFLIPKEIPQSTIAMGTAAPAIREKSIYPLTVMNYILGGASFTSRLMREIRVKRGLSYAVMSVIRFRKNTGVFIAFAQTKHESTGKTLSLLTENIALMSKDAVTEDELAWTKESIKNSYIFGFDSPRNVLGKYLDTAYNELPATFYKNYLKNISIVKQDEILKHSKDIFNNGLIKVIVGKEDLKRYLAEYGKVVIINNKN